MSRLGDSLYRGLLRAFPRRSRDQFGDEMARAFAEQRRQLAGRPIALAALWIRAASKRLKAKNS